MSSSHTPKDNKDFWHSKTCPFLSIQKFWAENRGETNLPRFLLETSIEHHKFLFRKRKFVGRGLVSAYFECRIYFFASSDDNWRQVISTWHSSDYDYWGMHISHISNRRIRSWNSRNNRWFILRSAVVAIYHWKRNIRLDEPRYLILTALLILSPF